ncbi:MAG: ribose 5-phosphate isomerase B [Clostridiales bacterium]|jgi:ribose 5-phosphate isomerase B|nr:ribose 5-phosphate isomerase B [Clostridiales bacterium]
MTILFVCTGNTCRSPIAEALARKIFKENGVDAHVTSAGTAASSGEPASAQAAALAKRHGLDLSFHKATEVTPDLANSADVVLVMTNNLKYYLREMSEWGDHVYTVAEFAGYEADVRDPFGKDNQAYEDCYNQLNLYITEFAPKIAEMVRPAAPIAIGCDHGGFALKKIILNFFDTRRIQYTDFGTFSEESVDYPIFAGKVCSAVLGGGFSKGILICGTGIGISIAANRHRGIRAALCSDAACARLSREHNDANVLCLGGRTLNYADAPEILAAFLDTPFSKEEKHARRIALLDS